MKPSAEEAAKYAEYLRGVAECRVFISRRTLRDIADFMVSRMVIDAHAQEKEPQAPSIEPKAKPAEQGAFVMVPREPTAEQLVKGWGTLHQSARNGYAAMIAAAPPTPNAPCQPEATVGEGDGTPATLADKLAELPPERREQVEQRIAELERERDAAFAMSRCECASDECCANLVKSSQRAEAAEREAAALRADAERWRKLCAEIDREGDAGTHHIVAITRDAVAMGAGALEIHIDAAREAP